MAHPWCGVHCTADVYTAGVYLLSVVRFSVDCEREQAATPVLPSAGDDDDLLNESAVSGYEGDKEDEGESFLELEGECHKSFNAQQFSLLTKIEANYVFRH